MAKLRAGIIGCGGRGSNHALGYSQCDRVVLVACADIHAPAAARLAQDFGVPATYSDYREMLSRERLDVVSMCLWPGLHTEAVLACLEAPHVPRLINAEKPMAPTYGEAVRMHEACQAAGVMLTFSHQRRFGPHFRKARDLIAEGAIGTLQRLEMDCSNLLDWGTHWFDMMLFFNNDLDPDWVMGQIACVEDSLVFGARIETAGISYVKWPNNVTGLLTTGRGMAAPVTIRATGSAGRVDVDHSKVMLLREGHAWERVAVPPAGVRGSDTTLHLMDSIDCLLTGRESILCSRNSLRATQLIFATYESSRRRTRIVLPLKTQDSALLTMLETGEMRIPDWPAFLTQEEKADGYRLLFDGKSMDGWGAAPQGTWTVSGGMLHVGAAGPGSLSATGDWGDVSLSFEFRLGNRSAAAVVLRADATAKGIEIPLREDRWEPRTVQSSGGIAGLVAPAADANIGGSRWNWIEADLRGACLTVKINDAAVLSCDLNTFPELAAWKHGGIVLRLDAGSMDVRNVMAAKPS